MNSKEFKDLFGKVANTSGYSKISGGWFKQSKECIVILELQKSNFGDYFLLNIKVFIQEAFGRKYIPNKDIIKSSMGHITYQIRDKDFLDFDISMNDQIRKEKMEILFDEFIAPFTDSMLSVEKIKTLAEKEEIFVLPIVKEEIEKIQYQKNKI